MTNQPVRRNAAAGLFILGICLVAIGAARQRGLVVIGIVFIILGAVRLPRGRR